MKIETLKKLIEEKYLESNDSIYDYYKAVMQLLDLYESDNSEPKKTTYIPVDNDQPDMVPAFIVCPCNPANGGSGVCGCTIGNRLVPNPKKYNLPQVSTNTSNTVDIYGQSNYAHTTNICDVDESELCDIVLGNSSIINTKEQFEQYRKNIFYRYLSYEERYAIWFRNNFETGMEWNPAVVPDFNNSYYEPTPVKVLKITLVESEIIEIYE